jgi:hypothetical protein
MEIKKNGGCGAILFWSPNFSLCYRGSAHHLRPTGGQEKHFAHPTIATLTLFTSSVGTHLSWIEFRFHHITLPLT